MELSLPLDSSPVEDLASMLRKFERINRAISPRVQDLQLGHDAGGEKFDEVDELVGLRGAVARRLALGGQGDDDVDGRVFEAPVGGRLRRVRVEHLAHVPSENVRHLWLEKLGQSLDQIAGGAPSRVHVRALDISTDVPVGERKHR